MGRSRSAAPQAGCRMHCERMPPARRGRNTDHQHFRGDCTLQSSLQKSFSSYPAILVLAGLATGLVGCRGRAYSDLYVENMAAEIRDLEDQLYEYDYQYRRLEQELAAVEAENRQLEHAPATKSNVPPAVPPEYSPLEFQPRGYQPSDGNTEAVPTPNPSDGDAEPQSILDRPSAGSADESGQPRSALPNRPNPPDSDAPATERGTLPDPSTLSPPDIELPQLPQQNFPASGGSGFRETGFDNFDGELLAPPSIEPGEPLPPDLPVLSRAEEGQSLPPSRDLELNLSRIEVPAQLASSSNRDLATARLTPARPQVTDERVVELSFHPSMSRAVNLDQRSDDDGVYLVLQPKNAEGQIVAVAAQLTISILDPSRDPHEARIGRWDYTEEEVRAKLQPIGSEAGVHLTLPWNGPDPTADRVWVMVRYTFPDGRQVVGEKTIFVSGEHAGSIVFAPRASAVVGVRPGEIPAPVATASHASHPTGQPSQASKGRSVVRPAAATGSAAPTPADSGSRPQQPSQFRW